GLHALGAALGSPALSAADLRQHNFIVFGVALLLATMYRARVREPVTSMANREEHFAVARCGLLPRATRPGPRSRSP
ncbi:MAG TPA: hypothetical protein VK898_04135, partial [Chloroflexota bacterium]|nr:hypothetical protein [Chloroflexota bacterium]